MNFDERDKIWEKTFDVYYDSYWVEILCEKVISIWQRIDDITKVLVAITASGSAVSGWSLWSYPGLKYIWIFLAGSAALLSITHASLGVANRVKDWTETKRQFTSLRIDIEKIRDKMDMKPDFDIQEYLKEYENMKKRYGDLYPNLRNDIICSRKLKNKAQDDLNIRIADLLDN